MLKKKSETFCSLLDEIPENIQVGTTVLARSSRFNLSGYLCTEGVAGR